MNILEFIHFTAVGHLSLLLKKCCCKYSCTCFLAYVQKVSQVIYILWGRILGSWVYTLSILLGNGKKKKNLVNSCTLRQIKNSRGTDLWEDGKTKWKSSVSCVLSLAICWKCWAAIWNVFIVCSSTHLCFFLGWLIQVSHLYLLLEVIL